MPLVWSWFEPWSFTVRVTRRGTIVYIEYQSVCPFVGIGSPPTPPPRECVPPRNQRGGHTRMRGSQWGRLERKPGTLSTLWSMVLTQRTSTEGNDDHVHLLGELYEGLHLVLRGGVHHHVWHSAEHASSSLLTSWIRVQALLKRLAIFPSPAGMSLTKLSLAGHN